jgi:hypothetical protein
MNPLLIARKLREQYLTLLTTAFAPRQEDLAEAFRAEIEKDGFLTREPFIALAQPYQHAAPIDGLSAEARARFGMIAERPYRHQADACRRILAGEPTVIATGTGSGKTEAFLMPIRRHAGLVPFRRSKALPNRRSVPSSACGQSFRRQDSARRLIRRATPGTMKPPEHFGGLMTPTQVL